VTNNVPPSAADDAPVRRDWRGPAGPTATENDSAPETRPGRDGNSWKWRRRGRTGARTDGLDVAVALEPAVPDIALEMAMEVTERRCGKAGEQRTADTDGT